MTEQEFMLNRQKSIERMFETANKTQNNIKQPTKIPSFVTTKADIKNQNEETDKDIIKNLFGNSLNLPFLEKIKTDSDIGIILGLILLLLCDNSDKYLLIALLYILI